MLMRLCVLGSGRRPIRIRLIDDSIPPASRRGNPMMNCNVVNRANEVGFA